MVYTHTYDREGNLTRKTAIATNATTEYSWDYHNRLTNITDKDANGNVTKQVGYTYDVYDRRIAKSIDMDGTGTAPVQVERLVYDGDDIALTFDGTGNQTHRYLHGVGVDAIAADETEGQVLWALSDHQGTVRDVVDSTGTVLNHLNYSSFGEVISQTNPSIDFRYGYTGRDRDEETGLSYYRSRYYDSAIGRFLSEDAIGFGGGDANLYRYVANTPVNTVDPFGNFTLRLGGDFGHGGSSSTGASGANRLNKGFNGLRQTYNNYRNLTDNVLSAVSKAQRVVNDPVAGAIDIASEAVTDAVYSEAREVIGRTAEEALQYYAERCVAPETPDYLRPAYAVGGLLTALATRENFDKTAMTLQAALLVDELIQSGQAKQGRDFRGASGDSPKLLTTMAMFGS